MSNLYVTMDWNCSLPETEAAPVAVSDTMPDKVLGGQWIIQGDKQSLYDQIQYEFGELASQELLAML